MKKVFYLIALTHLSFFAFGTVHTVSNMDSSVQFTSIQAACDASNSGDSIYVSPSPINYDPFTIDNKKLAVFGPGWAPFVGGTATVQACYVNGTGATGSEIQGFIFLSDQGGNSISINSSNINNLIIKRNELHILLIGGNADGYLIEGNWFDATYDYSGIVGIIFGGNNNLSNALIRNNIFFSCGLLRLTGNKTVIDHNLFYGNPNPIGAFQSTTGFTITNNIIQINFSPLTFSTFNNNITYNSGNDTPWIGNNNINAGGNRAGQNPQMADEASVDADVDNPLLNFTIKSGPANNAGSDGLDMGLLFDKGKVTNWNYSRATHLPYMTELNITDQNIFSNGYIHFNGKAKSN
jgi:hypothetical protein